MSHIKLGDLFRVGSSKRVLQSQWTTGGVPFYRGREITKLSECGFVENDLFITEELFNELSHRSGVPQAGDIMITAIGTIGNSYIVCPEDRFYFKDASVLWLARNSDVSTEYINHWLKSPLFLDQLDRGNGATVDTLTIQKLQSVSVHVPSASEQHRIVTLLDEAFADIATAKANAEKNLQNAHELLDNYLEKIFATISPDWKKATLQSLCEKITDGTHQTPTYFESGVIFLSSRNVTSGEIDWNNIKYIDEKQHLEMHRRVAPRVGDILLAKNGTTGVAAMVDKNEVFDIYVSLALIRPLGVIHPKLLLHFINSPTAKKQFNRRLKGTGVPNLHLEEIRQVEVNFPISHATQDRLVMDIEVFKREVQRLEAIYRQKLTALDDLKKSLLHQAFSGQL